VKECSKCDGQGRRVYLGKDGPTLDIGPAFPGGLCVACGGTGVDPELPFHDLAKRQVQKVCRRGYLSPYGWSRLIEALLKESWQAGFRAAKTRCIGP
jgi:hypothetical protein